MSDQVYFDQASQQAGGARQLRAALEWASGNLSAAEKGYINARLESRDVGERSSAVEVLMSKHEQAVGFTSLDRAARVAERVLGGGDGAAIVRERAMGTTSLSHAGRVAEKALEGDETAVEALAAMDLRRFTGSPEARFTR